VCLDASPRLVPNPPCRDASPASGGVSIRGSSCDRHALSAARSQPQLTAIDGNQVPPELEGVARDLPIAQPSAGVSSHDDPPGTRLLRATVPMVTRLEIVPKLGASVTLNRSERRPRSRERPFSSAALFFTLEIMTIFHIISINRFRSLLLTISFSLSLSLSVCLSYRDLIHV